MKKLLMTVAVLFVSTFALAQDEKGAPKWGYVEAGYIDFNPDEGISDDGVFAGVSFGFLKMIHVFAEYDDVGDFKFWNVGAGWHGLLGDPADLYAQVTWNDVEYEDETNDFSDDGYEIGAGIRWKLLKWLELNGELNWTDFDEAGDDVGGKVGVLFTFLDDKLGAGASYEVLNEADQVRAYARWNFGR